MYLPLCLITYPNFTGLHKLFPLENSKFLWTIAPKPTQGHHQCIYFNPRSSSKIPDRVTWIPNSIRKSPTQLENSRSSKSGLNSSLSQSIGLVERSNRNGWNRKFLRAGDYHGILASISGLGRSKRYCDRTAITGSESESPQNWGLGASGNLITGNHLT